MAKEFSELAAMAGIEPADMQRAFAGNGIAVSKIESKILRIIGGDAKSAKLVRAVFHYHRCHGLGVSHVDGPTIRWCDEFLGPAPQGYWVAREEECGLCRFAAADS